MEYYCDQCHTWYYGGEPHQLTAPKDDNLGIIAAVFCPNCGYKGFEIYEYVYSGQMKRAPYDRIKRIMEDYKLEQSTLDDLLKQEIDCVHDHNPIKPLNLLEQLEVLEQPSLFSDGR